MTVQDREGTAFCLSCENAGLHARIAELEATATGPERDLAEQALEMLERLAREWGISAVWADPDEGYLVSVSWGDPSFDEPDTPKELHYYIRGTYGTRAEALALLEKGAK
jgi:hypothetical protein